MDEGPGQDTTENQDPNKEPGPISEKRTKIRLTQSSATLLLITGITVAYNIGRISATWAASPDRDILTMGTILLTSLSATAAGWQISLIIDRWHDQADIDKIPLAAAYALACVLISMGSQKEEISMWSIIPGLTTGFLIETLWSKMTTQKGEGQEPGEEADPNTPSPPDP